MHKHSGPTKVEMHLTDTPDGGKENTEWEERHRIYKQDNTIGISAAGEDK